MTALPFYANARTVFRRPVNTETGFPMGFAVCHLGRSVVGDHLAQLIADALNHTVPPFQARVRPWMEACFGWQIAVDRTERNHRFLEEALELVQSLDCTADDAHRLVDYVFGRPAGEPHQEVGGVMVTLAALCLAADLDLNGSAEDELARIWTKIDQIRAKQAAKPHGSPLPGATGGE